MQFQVEIDSQDIQRTLENMLVGPFRDQDYQDKEQVEDGYKRYPNQRHVQREIHL